MVVFRPFLRRHRADLWIAAFLFFAAALLAHHAARETRPFLFVSESSKDVYFQGDVSRVTICENQRWSHKHGRDSVHPIVSLLIYPPVFLLKHVFRMKFLPAVQLFHAGIAGAWLAGYYLILRKVGTRRWDAVVFAAVGGTSAAAIFWLPVAELYPLGSLSMFPAIALAAGETTATAPYVWAAMASLSVTVTNWMAGLAAAWVRLPFARAVRVGAYSLVAIAAIAGVQRLVFPQAGLFFKPSTEEERWMFRQEMGGPIDILRTLTVHTMVMPDIGGVHNSKHEDYPLMSVQREPLGGPATRRAAEALWLLLLAGGVYALIAMAERRSLRLFLTLVIAGQLLLHQIYGEETFLYGMHVMPLLVLAAALATRTRLRPVVLAAAVGLAFLDAGNNVRAWHKAQDYLWSYHGSLVDPADVLSWPDEAVRSRSAVPMPPVPSVSASPLGVSLRNGQSKGGGRPLADPAR